MKAFPDDAAPSYAITEVPALEPDPGEVRIKVDQVGMSGTDLHIHEGQVEAVFPLTLACRLPLEHYGQELEALAADPTVHNVVITA